MCSAAFLLQAKPANLLIFSICSYPSKNANNSYIVPLTADALHCTYREVVLMQQTYIFIQQHPSHREEESCHTTTDESSLKSTIIVLHTYVAKPVLLYHVYVNEYHGHGNIPLVVAV